MMTFSERSSIKNNNNKKIWLYQCAPSQPSGVVLSGICCLLLAKYDGIAEVFKYVFNTLSCNTTIVLTPWDWHRCNFSTCKRRMVITLMTLNYCKEAQFLLIDLTDDSCQSWWWLFPQWLLSLRMLSLLTYNSFVYPEAWYCRVLTGSIVFQPT